MLVEINLKSSCADLIRASTPWFGALEGVDAHGFTPWAEGPRIKSGQDEISEPISSLIQPQDFPRTALRFHGNDECPSVAARFIPGQALITRLAGNSVE